MSKDSLIDKFESLAEKASEYVSDAFVLSLDEIKAIIREHEALQSQGQNLTINEPSLSNEVGEISYE